MKTLFKTLIATALVASVSTANAFWNNDGWSGTNDWNGWGNGVGAGDGAFDSRANGDMDVDTEFTFSFKGRAKGKGRADGYGNGRNDYDYRTYGYGYHNSYSTPYGIYYPEGPYAVPAH